LLPKQLAKQVPRGKIYAVDIDSNIIKQAKKRSWTCYEGN